MKKITDSVAAELALQEEMTLQYEAIVAEMNQAPRERRLEYVQQLSDHLRRLSEYTRSTSHFLRYGT